MRRFQKNISKATPGYDEEDVIRNCYKNVFKVEVLRKCTYVGDSEIGKLIHDFKCTDADDMYYALLAKKVRFYKEDEKGVAIMCKAMEEMRNETNREKKGIAVELIKEGTLSLDKIAAVCNLTVEEVKELTMQPA